MRELAAVVLFVLAALALWGRRWAYVAFIAVAVLWIPARVDFRLRWPSCETIPTLPDAVASLGNWPHVVLFAIFFVLTVVQLRGAHAWRLARAAMITLAFGVIIELEQGATRTGNCELRDLIPDALGALIGAGAMTVWYGRGVIRGEEESQGGGRENRHS